MEPVGTNSAKQSGTFVDKTADVNTLKRDTLGESILRNKSDGFDFSRTYPGASASTSDNVWLTPDMKGKASSPGFAIR